jgi:hypothetical protein
VAPIESAVQKLEHLRTTSATTPGWDRGFGATDPPPATALTPQAIARLTAVEYANTVRDLLGIAPSDQSVPLAAGSVAGGFSIGGTVTEDGASAYHDSAVQLATLATSATNLPSLLKPANCTAPADDDGSKGAACASAFVTQLAPIAFRHGPVDATTLAELNELYTTVAITDSLGFTSGIAAVLEAR